MPTPVLTLDRVQDHQIEIIDGTKARIDRTGHVKPLDTSLSKPEILASALSAKLADGFTPFPAYGSNYPSSDPILNSALMRHVRVITVPGQSKALVYLRYETPDGQSPGGGGSAFVLERRTTLVTKDKNFHPGDGTPFKVTWTNLNSLRTHSDVRPMPVFVPMQQLTATGYFIGDPPAEMTTAIRSVNDKPWCGFPKGFWMYVGEVDRTEDKGRSYSISLAFLNQVIEDWSDFQFLQDETGRTLPPDKIELALYMAIPYEYAVVRLSGAPNPPNGFIKVGNYPMADFNSIFGFDKILP
jgi:hypothetical protein